MNELIKWHVINQPDSLLVVTTLICTRSTCSSCGCNLPTTQQVCTSHHLYDSGKGLLGLWRAPKGYFEPRWGLVLAQHLLPHAKFQIPMESHYQPCTTLPSYVDPEWSFCMGRKQMQECDTCKMIGFNSNRICFCLSAPSSGWKCNSEMLQNKVTVWCTMHMTYLWNSLSQNVPDGHQLENRLDKWRSITD